jgi:hypothetical protein
MMAALPNPFILEPDQRFSLDIDAFIAAIDPPPVFLQAPRPEYLRAAEIMPIVELIGTYARPDHRSSS